MTSSADKAPAKDHNQPIITPEMVADHGFSEDEYQTLLRVMGREPTYTELGVFSGMWSEHCSYKSSKVHLMKFPTSAPWVIQGPGENAGVVDIGDGKAAVFKMESHNHPSFIEPYEGAATGVGGILRDVFTMGARPIANMNALRFGSPDHPRTRHLVAGVVAGIGGYGNCVGVPTLGGETIFHESYNGNILVNAMTVGLADKDKIFYSAAAGVGNPLIYVGSGTGRDGIHGATMASAEFDDDSQEKRPTVQVGDPFTEKLLIEACLELMADDSIVAIQDMGAVGLTSSSVEMASKGSVGLEIDLDLVPVREENMTAYEIMLSESQERMLMVLKPERERYARDIFRKWGLDFSVIGIVTDTERLVLKHEGAVVADIPVTALTDTAPQYNRPYTRQKAPAPLAASEVPRADDYGVVLLELLGSADLASRRWIWEQYDHGVMGDTIQHPGGDAAVVRVHGTNLGLAMTTDCTPRYVKADPAMGGKQAVAEAWRNLTAVGARPLAITDCLNFGNPERPEIMGQFAYACEGMVEACETLEFPVVSGNVSLYNETSGQAVLPAPAIGGVGVIDDLSTMVTLAFKQAGDAVLLIGETAVHLGQSLYLREICGREDGPPPPVDLDAEKRNGDFVRGLITARDINGAHDISDGGLYIALAEMALAGDLGCDVTLPASDVPLHAQLFGEDQARYLLTASQDKVAALVAGAAAVGVTIAELGTVGGDRLSVDGDHSLALEPMRETHEGWLPGYMA